MVHGECWKVLTLLKQERALKCSLDTANGSLTCCSLFCYSDYTCIFWKLETNVFGLSSCGSLEFFLSVCFCWEGHWRMQEKQITACYLPLKYNNLHGIQSLSLQKQLVCLMVGWMIICIMFVRWYILLKLFHPNLKVAWPL